MSKYPIYIATIPAFCFSLFLSCIRTVIKIALDMNNGKEANSHNFRYGTGEVQVRLSLLKVYTENSNQSREVGALGFEPRSAGFHHAGSDPARINGSSLQLFITGQPTR